MSTFEVDSDGFTKVKSKKRSSKNTKKPQKESLFELEKEVHIDVAKAIQRTWCIVDELKLSNYSEGVIKSVSSIIRDREVVEILCLGLGHVAESHISKYQLALLLCLKQHCDPEKVLVYDPIFYKSECDLLSKLGLELIPENNEGGYVISAHGPTVVYFPHCSKQMTNNFLWSNWGPNLQNCILICNSFSRLIDSQPSRILWETVPFICKIFSHTSEQPLKNSFKFTDIFNDTSIHTFPKDALEKLDSDFWTKGDKPTYKNLEEFITSSMIQKLNI